MAANDSSSNDLQPKKFDRDKRGRAKVDPMTDVGRSLPSSFEAERAVLSCMLQAPDLCVGQAMEKLGPLHFYLDAHKHLYETIITGHDKGRPVDLVSLHQHLDDTHQLERIGGPATLGEIYNMSVSPAHLEHYATIVEEKYTLRTLIEACGTCINRSFEEQDDIPRLLDEVEEKIMRVRSDRDNKKTMVGLKQHVLSTIDKIQQLYKGSDVMLGTPTGYKDFDGLTNGLHGGDMFIIAARPSMGKTSFVMNIVEHVSVDLGLPSAVFSLEMSAEQLVSRMLCSRARVNMRTIGKNQGINKAEFRSITKAGSDLSNATIIIDDTPSISIIDLRSKARRFHKAFGIKLIAIDYLQLMRSTSKRAQENRQFEIAEISAGLKAIAKELNIPVIVLAQLNRNPEARTSGKTGKTGKPKLSDLRESGSIEQDADLVGLLYRPEYYAQDEEDRKEDSGKAELLIAKHRNGALGTIPLTFIKELMRFETRAFEEGDGVEE
jgi:replicative DNA helicase